MNLNYHTVHAVPPSQGRGGVNTNKQVGKVIAINEGFCLLKMIKCRRRQATNPQKFKNCQRSFSRFLLVESEAVEVEAISTFGDI